MYVVKMSHAGCRELFSAVLYCLFFHLPVWAAQKNYEGYKLLTLTPTNQDQVDYLTKLWLAGEQNIDFWKPPSRPGQLVDVLLPPNIVDDLKTKFTLHKIKFITKVNNIKPLILNETHSAKSRLYPLHFSDQSFLNVFKLDRYHDFSEIESYIRRQSKQNPDIVRIQEIGKSHENRPLLVVKIGKPLNASKYRKPAVWVDAGIHARYEYSGTAYLFKKRKKEWISPAVATYFIHKLTKEHDKDTKVMKLLEKLDFYILPVMNPDGYEYSRKKDRMWRKNRSPCQKRGWLLSSYECCGVDLNRNFDWKWGSVGSSKQPCTDVYHGKAPFSEPESSAVRDFVLRHKESIKSFITLHSYGQLWIYPFGHRRRTYTHDKAYLMKVARKATKALESVHGTKYAIGTGADLLYEAAGGSDDWSKGVAKIKLSYLVELRPSDTNSNGFLLPDNEIIPTARETWEAIETLAKEVVKKYLIEKETGARSGSSTTATPKQAPLATTGSISRFQTTTETVCLDFSALCVWYTWGWFNSPCKTNERVQKICKKSCDLC